LLSGDGGGCCPQRKAAYDANLLIVNGFVDASSNSTLGRRSHHHFVTAWRAKLPSNPGTFDLGRRIGKEACARDVSPFRQRARGWCVPDITGGNGADRERHWR
jgi:hypothetical protein